MQLYMWSRRPLTAGVGWTPRMTDSSKLQLGRALLALFTVALLVVTFYFPLIGLGYALDREADFESRRDGALLVLPSVVLLLLLAGLMPFARGRSLLWLGIGANLLLLAPVIACARMGFPAAFGVLAAIAYSGTWWRLIRAKIGQRSVRLAG
jgi:hypothetical protein